MELYLGIDTSCYTTSLAMVDGEGNLFSEARKLLSVPPGGKGLAQNEALFQHITNLPDLFQQLIGDSGTGTLRGVAASIRPRPVEGSYMPVFRVAQSYGMSLANLLGIPFTGTSHQEGHLAAGIWSARGPREGEFLACHLSGGTTEILHVTGYTGLDRAFNIKLLGGTNDLHAGQFIDRVGVSLGLSFPAGPQLELLARQAEGNVSIPSAVKGYEISFSGPETAARRLIDQGTPAGEIARAVEKCIANSLRKIISKAVEDTGIKAVLIVGGVSANSFIRRELSAGVQQKPVNGKLYFASPGLSSDNAVGTALIGMSILKGTNLLV
ncbi:MAG: Kae1-like domain-containing protein [Eubacteriales bacterium]